MDYLSRRPKTGENVLDIDVLEDLLLQKRNDSFVKVEFDALISLKPVEFLKEALYQHS